MAASPIHGNDCKPYLVGKELELLRDKNDNVIIICSIEKNMDPNPHW